MKDISLSLEEGLSFIVSRERLMKSIQGSCAIAGRKTIDGFIANINLCAVDGKVVISGSSNEMSVTCYMDCTIERNGTAFVMANMLFEIIRKIPEDERISVAVFSPSKHSIEQGFLQISCSSSVFKLPLASKDEHLLSWDESDYDEQVEISAFDINKVFSKVIFASSVDATRRFINSVFVDIDDEINVVATDGHRMANISISRDVEIESAINFILPRKSVAEILKILSSYDDQEKVKIFVADRKIAIRFHNLAIVVIKIDSEYPDYKSVVKIFNDDGARRFSVDASVLYSSLDRVSSVVVDKVKAVDLMLSRGRLEIIGQSHGFGSFASEIISIDYSGEDVTLFLNAKYVLDVLDRIDGTSIICVFKSSDDPVLFLDSAMESYKYVVMPMVKDNEVS